MRRVTGFLFMTHLQAGEGRILFLGFAMIVSDIWLDQVRLIQPTGGIGWSGTTWGNLTKTAPLASLAKVGWVITTQDPKYDLSKGDWVPLEPMTSPPFSGSPTRQQNHFWKGGWVRLWRRLLLMSGCPLQLQSFPIVRFPSHWTKMIVTSWWSPMANIRPMNSAWFRRAGSWSNQISNSYMSLLSQSPYFNYFT